MDGVFDYNDAWLDETSNEDMRRIIDAFYRVHKLTVAATDYRSVLELILSESISVGNAEASSLLLYDALSDELYFSVTKGDSDEHVTKLKEVRLRLDQGIAGEAATTRKTVNVRDAASDPRIHREADATTGFTTRSLLAVPMMDRERLVGVLEVVNKLDGDGFTEADERIMEMFASLVASIITQARLIAESVQAERMAAIGQTVAGLSHYTKNILAGIEGSVELIEQGMDKDDPETLEVAWGIMKRSTGRLSNVVEDMLAYSKEREPERSWCDVVELLEDVLSAATPLIDQKAITVERDFRMTDGKVCLDTIGIHRCLLNLVLNAVDAVSFKEGNILLRAYSLDRVSLVLEIEDNGQGIDSKVKDTIFKPFVSTKGSRGTGLGLAVTHKIIIEHDGTIVAGNRAEGGARFTITLPHHGGEKESVS